MYQSAFTARHTTYIAASGHITSGITVAEVPTSEIRPDSECIALQALYYAQQAGQAEGIELIATVQKPGDDNPYVYISRKGVEEIECYGLLAMQAEALAAA